MTENTAEATTTEKVEYVKGTWQAALNQSTVLADKGAQYKKRAGVLLWQGATSAIAEWETTADTDVSAENLAASLLDIMGTARKGDVSKIKTVALAVRNHGLQTSIYPNLSKAYAEARRLTQTIQQDRADDEAADAAVEALAASVPSSTTTPEGAALILLSKGIDGAVVAILDALGANNEAAHRAFMRAVSTEVAARVQAAKPKPAPKAGPKAGATQAKPGGTKPKAAVKTAGTKPKAAAAKAGAKASPAKKAAPAPVSASKGDPNRKALPPKQQAEPVEQADKAAPVEQADKAAPAAVQAAKAAPVKAKPVAVKATRA